MSTAVTMLAKKMTREQRLPFELSVDPFYSEQNQARLRKSIAEMEATGGTIHEVKLDDKAWTEEAWKILNTGPPRTAGCSSGSYSF